MLVPGPLRAVVTQDRHPRAVLALAPHPHRALYAVPLAGPVQVVRDITHRLPVAVAGHAHALAA